MAAAEASLTEPLVTRLNLHSGLGADEQQALRDLPSRLIHVGVHTDFVQRGEVTDEASFIVDGLVGRYDQTRKGDRQVTAVYLAGDLPDLHSVVVPESYSALHTFAASTLIRIPHAALLEIAAKHPAIAQAFWRECVLDVAKVSKWVVSVARKDALSRLAHLMCEMACRSTGSISPGTADFGFPVTQADLGDMLNVSPVHIRRTLKSMRLANLVSLTGGRVQILDWKKLTRIADFHPRYLSLNMPILAGT